MKKAMILSASLLCASFSLYAMETETETKEFHPSAGKSDESYCMRYFCQRKTRGDCIDSGTQLAFNVLTARLFSSMYVIYYRRTRGQMSVDIKTSCDMPGGKEIKESFTDAGFENVLTPREKVKRGDTEGEEVPKTFFCHRLEDKDKGSLSWGRYFCPNVEKWTSNYDKALQALAEMYSVGLRPGQNEVVHCLDVTPGNYLHLKEVVDLEVKKSFKKAGIELMTSHEYFESLTSREREEE